jgi:hypothetical protein
MTVGNIHCDQPLRSGSERKLPPGRSMNNESHTSPRTFANEVSISAKTTSEKNIGSSIGENKHRQRELQQA